jgi:endonuclease/exonuclease/phosphatase family metal-dependent hydrolase
MKAKKKLPVIDKFFLFINCGFALALLISYFAPVTDPRQYWIIAFFGLAYPPLLLVNILLIIYWLFRNRWLALISFLSILCGFNVFSNNFAFNKTNSDLPKPTDTNNIRMMTYNVHDFKKYSSTEDIPTKHEILAIIKNEQPDIVGFQEFFTHSRGQYDMVDSMKKAMGSDNYYYVPMIGNAEQSSGVAIFSKIPIVAKGYIQLSDGFQSVNQGIYVDVKKGSRIFRVYSVHLQSIGFVPQDYQYVDTVSNSGKADISSTRRLGSKLKRAFLRRSEQMFRVKASAANCPYPYIISGDFNDTPASFVYNQMIQGLKSAFREKGFGMARTYNGAFPNFQIDYIMVTPQFNVLSYNIIKQKLSDHYPVCSDLVLK